MGLVVKIARYIYFFLFHYKFGEFHKTSYLGKKVYIRNKKNLFLSEHTNISAHAQILNGRAPFVMKKYSGAAIGLLVVTGSHMSVVGKPFKFVKDSDKDKLDINHEYDKAVIVEEDVWIGSNVVLMQGVVIGRGAVVGAGSVIRKSPPPYSIVAGNPAKVIGFRFTPEEIIKHEEQIYPEKERLQVDVLEKNYQKYYTGRVKDIKAFLKQ